MRLCLFFTLALALLYCATARQAPFVAPRRPNHIQQSQFIAQAAPRSNVAQCFGLARRTRTRSIQVPVLYNSLSGQTAAVPDYLFSLDDRTIDKMEADGWEVRLKTFMTPQSFYQRVPMCCPWDTACHHGQQRMSVSVASPVSRTSPCANGGVVVSRGGVQACSCPAGFQGTWCQIPDLIQSSFPSGPVIPYNYLQNRRAQGPSDVLKQAVRQAQLWKEKMFSSRQPPVVFGGRGAGKGPLLSPNDHFLNSINKQWVKPTRTSDQALKMKIAMMNMYMKQQAQQMNNQQRGRLHPMMASVLKAKDYNSNPYSLSSTQPQLNPQMVSMINHLQGRAGLGASMNSYGQSFLPVQVQGYKAGTLGRNQGPQARTPWDMDPWERQRGGMGHSLMGGQSMGKGRDKLIALAFAQYLQNIQRKLSAGLTNGRGGLMQSGLSPPMNSRISPPRQPQPMNPMTPGLAQGQGIMNPPMIDTMSNARPPFQSDQSSATTEVPIPLAGEDLESVELPVPGNQNEANIGLNQVNQPIINPGLSQLSGVGPMTQPQLGGMGPMTNQQMPPLGVGPMSGQMPQGMPLGGGPMPKMPSQEELKKMTECRVVLEPKITMCMKDAGHHLTLEEFMNPEFIDTAREVCSDSEGVGQCVMRQDQACGEGSSVDMTRKMIDSVLQMMGMVCGQIVKLDQQRGINSPQTPPMPNINSPQLTTVPQNELHNLEENLNTGMPVNEEIPATTHATEKPLTSSSANSVAPPKITDKFTTSKFGSGVTNTIPAKAASKSDNGHHSLEPVDSGVHLMGYPLWLVSTLGGLLLLLIFVSLLVVCLAIRRRRRRKERALNKELERIPEQLDPKLYALGIPPPQYATTSVKTQDELSLPPLDIVDESDHGSVSVKEESDGEEETKKVPISDDDADDESDEKEENSEKKKKEKKEKK